MNLYFLRLLAHILTQALIHFSIFNFLQVYQNIKTEPNPAYYTPHIPPLRIRIHPHNCNNCFRCYPHRCSHSPHNYTAVSPFPQTPSSPALIPKNIETITPPIP